MRERDRRESPAGTRVTRLVAFVSHGSNRCTLSLFSVALHGRTTRKSRASRLQVDSRYSLVGSSFHRSFEDRIE